MNKFNYSVYLRSGLRLDCFYEGEKEKFFTFVK